MMRARCLGAWPGMPDLQLELSTVSSWTELDQRAGVAAAMSLDVGSLLSRAYAAVSWPFFTCLVVGLVIEGLNELETQFMTEDSHSGALGAGHENPERPSRGCESCD